MHNVHKFELHYAALFLLATKVTRAESLVVEPVFYVPSTSA